MKEQTETSGQIVKNVGNWEPQSTNFNYVEKCKHFVCNLKNMQVKEIQRRKKKESVTEEKYALLFQAKFQIFGKSFDVSLDHFIYIFSSITFVLLE